MQTHLAEAYQTTGKEAEALIRTCVHCGFCTATCPTYQLLGDELDGPRGRIYLIKQMLEGHPASIKTQTHLDRCLTCRSCETTCPSGVQYGKLLDYGRNMVEQQVPRTVSALLLRRLLRLIIPHRHRFAALLAIGRFMRPILPSTLANKIPLQQNTRQLPTSQHPRTMLALQGCVQPSATPLTHAAAARVLDKLGITLLSVAASSCCGALSHHLNAEQEAQTFARQNIDAWWPHIEAGAEAIVITASACTVMVKDYHHLLQHDPLYTEKAMKVSTLCRDLVEILQQEDLSQLTHHAHNKIAVHAPCTLQHGQQLNGALENILSRSGFSLTKVPDAHLCCGSAGTYSLLQAELSQQLLSQKLNALNSGQPDYIVTANVGCQMHLASQSNIPVKHWIELLDS